MEAIFLESLADLYKRQEEIVELLNEIKNSSDKENIYSLNDIEDILKVSRRTIATWTKNGILPHTKVGNKIWVTEEQLNQFLDEHSNNAGMELKIRKGGNHDK
jgi:excisionase family DNA binding protein